MKSVLLLGGAGFIGSNLSETFINHPYNVTVYDKEDGNFENLKTIWNNINVIKGDLNDAIKIENIFIENNVDFVIHLADSFISSTEHDTFIKDLKKNLFNTINIIDIMQKHNVKKLIYFSSLYVMGIS